MLYITGKVVCDKCNETETAILFRVEMTELEVDNYPETWKRKTDYISHDSQHTCPKCLKR